MMKHLTTAAALLLLALMPALQGCGDDGPPRVAALLPLSGASAVYGEPVRRGVLLAAEELQEAHEKGLYPYDLRVEVRDTQGDPVHAAQMLTDLYDQGVLAAVGGVTDDEAAALARVSEAAERVLVSPTASSPDLPASRQFFRLFPTADREANKMASFSALELGLRKAVVLVAETPTATAAADAFQEELERNRGEVLARLSYPRTGEIPAALVKRAVGSGAEALYVADFTARGEELVQALDRAGFRGVLLTTSALTAPKVLAAVRQAADGALVTQAMFDPDSDNPKVEMFLDAYRERWGEAPDLFAAHGYDALEVLARALLTEQAHGSQLWKGLRGLTGYRGVTGFLQFDPQGRAGKFPRVYVVDDGALDPVEGMPDWKKERLARRVP
jgi:branched-chain amino acid transport system substrate-binding protein